MRDRKSTNCAEVGENCCGEDYCGSPRCIRQVVWREMSAVTVRPDRAGALKPGNSAVAHKDDHSLLISLYRTEMWKDGRPH